MFTTKLFNYLKAGYPSIAVKTVEETMCINDIIATAEKAKRSVYIWSATEGLTQIKPSLEKIANTDDIISTCAQKFEKAVYIFLDTHTWPIERDPQLERSIKDLIKWAPSAGSCVMFVGSTVKAPSSFANMVTVLDFSLPDEKALAEILDASIDSIKAGKKDAAIEVDREAVLKALSGLSTTEAENAIILSFVETNGSIDPTIIYREKIQSVKRSGMLEIINPEPLGINAIGGMEGLKEYIIKRKKAFGKDAEKYGLPIPKGIMCVGVPGAGKSLFAKAVSTVFGVPLLKFDIGSVFGSLVGDSEKNIKMVLELAEAIAPCVLWLDEIEKALGGVGGSGNNDSGVTKRVFGTLLNWMQERKRPVFLIATANAVNQLPPEFIRRWDEVFAVDLPTTKEREEIFNIHITKVKRDPKKFEISKLVKASENYTGAEIEKAVISGMYAAFSEDREVNTDDVLKAIKELCPVSSTMKEQIDAIRQQIGTRFRRASAPEIAKVSVSTTSSGSRKLN